MLVFCLPTLATADEPAQDKKQPQGPPKQTISPEPPKPPTMQEVLDARAKEAKDLSVKATDLTIEIGKLAASGKLPQDDEAMKLMKSMVDALQQIKDRLKSIDEEIAALKGQVDGQKKAQDKMSGTLGDLAKHKDIGYLQFQYRDTDQRGGAPDSFRVRRSEIGFAHTIDPRTSMKVTFDLATSDFGSTVNTTTDATVQLKDAYLTYLIDPTGQRGGTRLVGGQTRIPLGYELLRSSSEREFPENAMYNQLLFDGERGRGVNLIHNLDKNWTVQTGVWDALTYNDTEQRQFQGSQQSRLGMTAGVRYTGKNFNVGVSGFKADRPALQVGYNGATTTKVFAPNIDRQFLYIDGSYFGLFTPGLFARAEAMFGKDRLPLTPNSTSSGSTDSGVSDPNSAKLGQKDMAGYQLMFGYNLNYRNVLLVRYEQFDPNLNAANDFIRGYGAAYIYYINPNAKITLSHEVFIDDSRLAVGTPAEAQRRYGVTTLRVQFKF